MYTASLRLFLGVTSLLAIMRSNASQLRARPEHGGHAVEYAIGIGASLVVMGTIITALKTGLGHQIASWVFGTP
jgi:hypothetical protein